MGAKIRFIRRVTSGNIKDPELHLQKLEDLEMRRQIIWTISLVAIGGLVIVIAAVCLSLGS